MNLPPATRKWSALVLLLGIGVPAIGDQIAPTALREMFWWAVACAIVVYVIVIERRDLRSLWLNKPSFKSVGIGIAAGIAIVISTAVIVTVVFPLLGLHPDESTIRELGGKPLWILALLALRAGVVEELLYRGLIIARGEEILGSASWPFAVSVAVFTVAHAFHWGLAHLLLVAMAGTILGLVFLWRRDLATNMVAHFVADMVMFAGAAFKPA